MARFSLKRLWRFGAKPASPLKMARTWNVRLQVEELEDRTTPSAGDTLASAIALPFGDQLTFQSTNLPSTLANSSDIALTQIDIGVGGEIFYQLVLTESSNLNARVEAVAGQLSLSLYDYLGAPIVRSDGQSTSDPNPSLAHGLIGIPDNGGTVYYLKVANLGSTAATYNLTAQLTPSASQLNVVPLGAAALAIAQGDFNGDGHLDLITTNRNPGITTPGLSVNLLLGNGDGTFQPLRSTPVNMAPSAIAVADFNGDGSLDVVAVGNAVDGVRVLLGNGDGTFQNYIAAAGVGGDSLAIGDFNGDGAIDLAVGNLFRQSMKVFMGDGTGHFQTLPEISLADTPSAVAAGDFDGDGQIDLAVSGSDSNQVTIFLGDGDGAFSFASTAATGEAPFSLLTADFDGDGWLDLATADINNSTASVLLGAGDGTFGAAEIYSVGQQPRFIVSGDFNGDGIIDLATANNNSNDATLLFGLGDGRFESGISVAAGATPRGLAIGDFDGDGNIDLVANNYYSKSVTVLLGHGDGTFPENDSTNQTGIAPLDMVTADFNGDGRLDIAVANLGSGDVTIILGQANGTFQNVGSIVVLDDPIALVAGDFNGDGRIDLAVAQQYAMAITVLLGSGDGSFILTETIGVNGLPSDLAIGDFSGDGLLDLAVVFKYTPDFYYGDSVALLLGDGRGSFTDGGEFTVGSQSVSVVAGDFNGDQNLDLVVGNYYSRDATVLLGDGLGGFQPGVSTAVMGAVTALTVGDFNGDTRLDVAVATTSDVGISLLLGLGDGSFSAGAAYDPGAWVSDLAAGDFNRDGYLDLAATTDVDSSTFLPSDQTIVYLGDGQGGLSIGGSYAVGGIPAALVSGDFNGDGNLDLTAASVGTSTTTTLLGTGAGDFRPTFLAPNAVQATPIVADLTGDQVLDTVVLNQAGQILFRRGLANQPGAFASPVVLNVDALTAARDLALVQDGAGGYLLAALNANTFSISPDLTIPRVARVTVYRPDSNGVFAVQTTIDLPAGFLPANIASADLNGDGLGDLVVTAAASNQVFVSLQSASGVFGLPTAYSVGVNPSSIGLEDVNNDSATDIVVTNRYSGQVSVLLNQGDGLFNPEERYRAGAGLYGMSSVNGALAVRSVEGSIDAVTGEFDDNPGIDLAVLNQGTGNLVTLSGDGFGGFYNPQAERTLRIGSSATAVVSGRFVDGDPNDHLAVLNADRGVVDIYLRDGAGSFFMLGSYNAGNQPTGLSVVDVSRPGGGGPDGILDLVVGNSYGDLLILTGNGDGTFSEYRRIEQQVFLAVGRSSTSQLRTFFFSDQGSDQLAVRTASARSSVVANASVFQDRTSGIQSPGPQQVITALGKQYLAVVNNGANSLLIYTLDSNGMPILSSKQVYFTGTDPVSLTVTTTINDLNGDSIPDVVIANQGSNDVSVFLGNQMGDNWVLSYRPRQNTGGIGPTSVAIANATGANGMRTPDTAPDLIVSNGQSSNVNILPNLGNGFFGNGVASGPSFQIGANPDQVFVGNFDTKAGLDLVTINASSNSLTLITGFQSAPVFSTIVTGSQFPLIAVAFNLNGDNASSLLVANSASGLLDLYQGTASGFEVVQSLDQSLVQHLSSLALVAAGDQIDIYGTNDVSQVAFLLGTFGPDIPDQLPSSPVPGGSPFAPGPEFADILPSVPGVPGGLQIAANSPSFNVPTLVVLVLGANSTNSKQLEALEEGFVGLLLSSTSFILIPTFLPAIGVDEIAPNDPDAEVKDAVAPSETNGIVLLNVEPETIGPDPLKNDEPPQPKDEPKENDPTVDLPGFAEALPRSVVPLRELDVAVATSVADTPLIPPRSADGELTPMAKTFEKTTTVDSTDTTGSTHPGDDTDVETSMLDTRWHWLAAIVASLWLMPTRFFVHCGRIGRSPWASSPGASSPKKQSSLKS